jgi:GDP-L-fucose synthase
MSGELKGAHVLVTGGAGFIASNLIPRLIAEGASVRSTVFNRRPLNQYKGVEYVQTDLTDLTQCVSIMEGIDAVFMCAANSSGAEVMQKSPLVHLTPNVIMNAACLAAAYEANVKRFVFISSNTVYPLTDHPVKESEAEFEFYRSYHIVGWMKRFSEVMCDMYTSKISRPMPVLTVRPGNLYGPFDKFTRRESKVIAALIRRAIERENPFVVWGNGNDIKDFLFIDDFVDALLLLYMQDEVNGPINVASGTPISIRQILPIILKHTGYESANVMFDESKPTMIPKRLIDIDYMTSLTGWVPKVSMEDGLLRTIDWYNSTFSSQTPEEALA